MSRVAILVVMDEDPNVEFFGKAVEKIKWNFKDQQNLKIYAAIRNKADELEAMAAPPEQSNLVDHAKRELELIGEEPETILGYLKVIRAFADMGHSGGSAFVAIPVINELLQFKNLSPLTDNPDEWMEVEGDMHQSRRNPEAFSTTNGFTYYLLSEVEGKEKVAWLHHLSAPSEGTKED